VIAGSNHSRQGQSERKISQGRASLVGLGRPKALDESFVLIICISVSEKQLYEICYL